MVDEWGLVVVVDKVTARRKRSKDELAGGAEIVDGHEPQGLGSDASKWEW